MKLIITLFILLGCTDQNFTQWSTQLYLPSYNNVFKGVHNPAGNKYFAVGENGTVRKSNDLMNTWTEHYTGTTFDLFSVAVYDTNNVIVAGDFGTLLKTVNSGVNWTPINVGTTDIIRCIIYLNLNTIIAGGESGRVFRTTNAGINWGTEILTGTTGDIMDMRIYTVPNGFLCTSTGEVFKTTNSGVNWTNAGAPAASSYNALEVIPAHILACGGDGKIIRSTNLGVNWVTLNTGVTSELNCIISPGNIIAAADDGSIILSTNNGTNFTAVVQPGANSPQYNSVAYGPNSSFLAFGERGNVIKSTNIGLNWSQVQGLTGTGRGIEEIYFPSPLTGYAVCGTEYFLKTSNGGSSWNSQLIANTYFMSSLCFVNTLTGFAGGNNGPINDGSAAVIMKTTNGGLNWSLTTIPGTITITSFSFYDVNTGWAVATTSGAAEKLYRTTNSGGNWNEIYSFNQEIAEIKFVNQQTGWVLGESGTIGRTTNGGTTWQNAATLPGNLFGISFPSQQTGFVCGTAGKIYRTTNGGQNWNLSPSGTTNDLIDIQFSSDLNGLCVGQSGTRLITSNGGNTWVLQQEPLNVDINACFMPTTINGYAAGSIGYISNFGGIVTGLNQSTNEIPVYFRLHQNYPNPFNPTTEIVFEIPVTSHVNLKIFDVSGRVVKVLVNETLASGKFNISYDASELSSGIYLCVMQAGEFLQTNKMILIK
jgi:photosystem II stability/assembly factor-like uncharacterized protein